MALTTHLQLVLRSTATPLLPVRTFMALSWTNFTLTFTEGHNLLNLLPHS